MKHEYAEFEEIGNEQKSASPFLTPKFLVIGAATVLSYNYVTDKMKQRDPLAITDEQPEEVEFSILDVPTEEKTQEQKKQRAVIPAGQQGHDLFKYVMLETKRREAMGRKNAELRSYMDGDSPAIGYGNRIKYLSDKWKAVVDKQGYKVTEQQAREMMYETFDQLKVTVSADMPHLDRHELWAVQSLAFNWGYGNIKKSPLYRFLKSGDKSEAARKAWMRCHASTENHRTSRRFEWALYTGNFDDAKHYADKAYKSLKARGDFKHYD